LHIQIVYTSPQKTSSNESERASARARASLGVLPFFPPLQCKPFSYPSRNSTLPNELTARRHEASRLTPVQSQMTRRIFTTHRRVRLPEGSTSTFELFLGLVRIRYTVYTLVDYIFPAPLMKIPRTHRRRLYWKTAPHRVYTPAPYPSRASVWSAAELASAP